MSEGERIGVCDCARIIFSEDVYHKDGSRLLCDYCAKDKWPFAIFVGKCTCGRNLFVWDSICIDPVTRKKLCHACGTPKIALARKRNAQKRRQKRPDQIVYFSIIASVLHKRKLCNDMIDMVLSYFSTKLSVKFIQKIGDRPDIK